MKFRMRKALLAGVMGMSMSAAEAAYIVDTGPGNSFSALSLTASQQLGATFNVAQASQITSVEGWIGQGTGKIAFSLHQGARPEGTVLFSTVVDITDPAPAFRGAAGLDWDVAAGDYTLTVVGQGNFSGGMETSPARPLVSDWLLNPLNAGWVSPGVHFGWRVGADVNPVPLPGALGFALLGIGALGARTRRRG